ncbi:unnamed protein product [Psylliodes chrysocephalus]|uniref:Ubiquitin carboxyl-terminal hydrolase 47 n=1 Tax=Psylliodes chrysocephalus TaxID=3402493 RepID=A0A9P0G1X7_9CUCU|nr:unnamed protein product [Psylliodes chrysocephala]
MVCLPEDGMAMRVTVRDTILSSGKKQFIIHLTPSKTISSIFEEVSNEFHYTIHEIELILQIGKKETHVLNESKNKTVQEAGIKWTPLDRLSIIIGQIKAKPMSLFVQESEDDLLLGASASPTAADVPSTTSLAPPATHQDFNRSFTTTEERRSYLKPIIIESTNYVGLVNQAMTCYLNSLLQALYMTPEFRNALYNWEFDGINESRSIPYQLQKLFLNLQTSSKSAVETTDLTYSFGWQNSDAWHQHDIQELCRVMFDALEQKFKDTKQANLINDLYEGKMLDYVKCLECGTEKSREDTFLDIPLPVRPFGNAVAYNSVEEALRAFVQPETLDGNNQYHCEKCNKKCDAHKGLKFTKFPYLLTLHLKRFDFDYNTMHRIKLNDKVVFSEKLNLNSFITVHGSENNETLEDRETVVKCDDCSTTDSGSADDESCQGTDVSSTVNGQDDNCADSDEGIDVSSGNNHDDDAKGPYVYELFSIMIHSGSASGGHYYAYIKDFDKNLWFCFNDQSVTGITEDDIRKTYGGGPRRGYYSGAYSSSTNAYMLMYRQIDKERNAEAIGYSDFPPHIKKLLTDMRKKEEEDRINREKENDMMRLTVYCQHPTTKILNETKLLVFNDSTLGEAVRDAYQRFNLDTATVDLKDCRLVVYNRKQECIDSSYESDEIKFCDILNMMQKRSSYFAEWMLEIREPETPWETFQADGINMKVYNIILETEEVNEPRLVRVDVDDTVQILKEKIGKLLNMDPETVKVVMEMYSNEPKYLDNDEAIVKFDSNCSNYKLYVSNALDEDPEKTFLFSKLKRLIQQFGYIISLQVVLPDTDVATLEAMSIPSLDLNQNLDKLELGSGDRCTNSPNLRVSPQPGQTDGFGDQSNSEDSSLSDSDRTLVGETPGDCIGMLPSSPTSPTDHHMASPGDPREDNYSYDIMGNPGEEMNWDDVETHSDGCSPNYYFKITSESHITDPANWENTLVRCCKILVDKRMTLERFKKNLEVILRVPSEYFKIYKHYANSEEEWSCLSDTLRSAKDGERLTLKLGRVLRKDELKCNVYHLKLDTMDVNNFLFEHIISRGQTVGSVKKEILFQAKKQHMLDIPYHKCRLREKSWKKPKRVYLDDQKFDKDIIVVSPNVDVYLQELPDAEPVTTREQYIFFVRQWCPSTLTLKPFQEVVLENLTSEELKKKLSELSDIPVEHMAVANIKQPLPCDIHVLDMDTHVVWHSAQVTNLEVWPVNAENGTVFFFSDTREELKKLTSEERKELTQKENTRLRRLNLSSYSPGGERALKIYLDTSPSKSEETID